MTKIYSTLFIFLTLLFYTQAEEEILHFATIADCQYHSSEGRGARKFSLSKEKLTKCVSHLNQLSLDYVIHLGDFIDKDFGSYSIVKPIYNKLNCAKYHALGNHEYSIADDKKHLVPKVLGMPSKYYDFNVKGWKFIVLDGNDISFHAYKKNSKEYKEAQVYYDNQKKKLPRYNGALSAKQLKWVEGLLSSAEKNNEPVILYCHFPVYPKNGHNLWNAEEVVQLIEKYSCVKAYINGHNHRGNYGKKNGVHYVTMKGMVDTEETSYATIKIDEDKIKIKGFGREIDRELVIKK